MAKLLGEEQWLISNIDNISKLMPDLTFKTIAASNTIEIKDSEGVGIRTNTVTSPYYSYVISGNGQTQSTVFKSDSGTPSSRIFQTSSGYLILFPESNGVSTFAINTISHAAAITNYYCTDRGTSELSVGLVTATKTSVAKISKTTQATITLTYKPTMYPVLEELPCNGERTDIYFNSQGRLVQAKVSDGNKNIFVPWILGLPDD